MNWTEVKLSHVPETRSSHGVAVIGDNIYMFGGEHEARTPIGKAT